MMSNGVKVYIWEGNTAMMTHDLGEGPRYAVVRNAEHYKDLTVLAGKRIF